MRNLMQSAAVAAILSLTLWGGQTHAAPITGLYNTGVNDDGTVRTHDQAELHYRLISSPSNAPIVDGSSNTITFAEPITPFVVTSVGGFPVGPWIGGNSISAWIGPRGRDAAGPVGDYRYRTTFDLTGFDPLTAVINGLWSTDNSGLDILINGIATGATANNLSAFTGFSITGGFVAGINTLDFLLNNAPCGGCENPTGLRVQILNTTSVDVPTSPPSTDVPEPLTLSLLGAGLAGIAAMRRRRG